MDPGSCAQGELQRARRGFVAALAVLLFGGGALAQSFRPALTLSSPEGAALVDRLRQGGNVIFFRHADTGGEPCDRSYRLGDRAGQRNISPAGRLHAAEIGRQIAALRIPLADPVLAGPVFRARDTAELAFGAEKVSVTDSLLADDYAQGRLEWVISEHKRLFSEPVSPGTNRVLVGHRGPVEMILGSLVSGLAFPEGAALVLEPGGSSGFIVLGILEIVPAPSGGNPRCKWQ